MAVPIDESDPIEMVASPVDFGGTPWAPRSMSPEFGQHTEEVLLELGSRLGTHHRAQGARRHPLTVLVVGTGPSSTAAPRESGIDRFDHPTEPLYVFADPAGHPFCMTVSDPGTPDESG